MRFLITSVQRCGWIAVLIAFATPGLLHAQVRSASYLKSNQMSKRLAGSASKLHGTTEVFHIFCSDRDSTWAEPQRAAVMERTRASLQFVQAQSRLYGIEVQFRETAAPDVQASFMLPTKVQKTHNWTEHMIRKSLARSGIDLVGSALKATTTDNVIFCLHINKPALSYNLAYYDNVAKFYSAERMVCFSSYPDGRETAAATYAHEILHLFGAGDLYFPYDRNDDRKRRAGQLFPDDVMFRVDYDLGRLNVGPYTAFRVGWNTDLDPRYEIFND